MAEKKKEDFKRKIQTNCRTKLLSLPNIRYDIAIHSNKKFIWQVTVNTTISKASKTWGGGEGVEVFKCEEYFVFSLLLLFYLIHYTQNETFFQTEIVLKVVSVFYSIYYKKYILFKFNQWYKKRWHVKMQIHWIETQMNIPALNMTFQNLSIFELSFEERERSTLVQFIW